jgi:hypothetical protein
MLAGGLQIKRDDAESDMAGGEQQGNKKSPSLLQEKSEGLSGISFTFP